MQHTEVIQTDDTTTSISIKTPLTISKEEGECTETTSKEESECTETMSKEEGECTETTTTEEGVVHMELYEDYIVIGHNDLHLIPPTPSPPPSSFSSKLKRVFSLKGGGSKEGKDGGREGESRVMLKESVVTNNSNGEQVQVSSKSHILIPFL